MNQDEARETFRRHGLWCKTPFVREDVAAALLVLEQETATLRTRLAEVERERDEYREEESRLIDEAHEWRACYHAKEREHIDEFMRAEELKRLLAIEAENRQRHSEAIARAERAEAELSQVREREAGMRAQLEAFAETAEAAVRAARRGTGGQQVPFHGDFANVPPSAVKRLEWWAREFRAALAPAPATEWSPKTVCGWCGGGMAAGEAVEDEGRMVHRRTCLGAAARHRAAIAPATEGELLGFTVVADPAMPPDRIEVRDSSGKVLGAITGIAPAPEPVCSTCRGAGTVDGTVGVRRCPECAPEPGGERKPCECRFVQAFVGISETVWICRDCGRYVPASEVLP